MRDDASGKGRRKTALLLADTQSYRVEDFAAAARALGIGFIVGSDRCHVLAEMFDERFLIVDFDRAEEAARAIVDFTRKQPVDAIIPGGDRMAVVAAMAARELGLACNPVSAALAASNKRLLREALARGGVRSPRHTIVALDETPERAAVTVASSVGFPCVVKPLRLSASRGVIRADDRLTFVRAFTRIATLLRTAEIRKMRDPENEWLIAEEFVPGCEVAVEGIVDAGVVNILAIFDKPDPLDGPFFEETIYVTPSRLPAEAQRAIAEETAAAARALGIVTGPIHAELRVSGASATVIEIAARSIGGLCSRALRFGVGASLEEIILRSALGLGVDSLEREHGASGVMMLPIPRAGILKDVRGVAAAEAIAGIESVTISVKPGQTVVPLPEGASYLGFVFARGETPEFVEAALRAAHAALTFVIAPSAVPTTG
ncbi:MAG: ATP-grasp domain-containing protein [bacterium]